MSAFGGKAEILDPATSGPLSAFDPKRTTSWNGSGAAKVTPSMCIRASITTTSDAHFSNAGASQACRGALVRAGGASLPSLQRCNCANARCKGTFDAWVILEDGVSI